jgi:hypothetical protein
MVMSYFYNKNKKFSLPGTCKMFVMEGVDVVSGLTNAAHPM